MEPLIPEKVLREEIIGVSAVTWWTWRREEKLPSSIKLGRRYYYRREDVENWLKDKIKNTAQETDNPSADETK